MGTPDPLSHVPTGPVPASKQGSRLLDLVRVMARLRGPDGCPWDRAQTHASLRRHLLDEAYELLDAIDEGDPVRIKEELGDLLLQSVFHAQMAADAGVFDIDNVAESTVEKLIHRHPHVFADVKAETPEQVYGNWERIKAAAKGEHGITEGIPKALPSLLAAQKIQRRAAGRGVDWAELAGAVEEVRAAVRGHGAPGSSGGCEPPRLHRGGTHPPVPRATAAVTQIPAGGRCPA